MPFDGESADFALRAFTTVETARIRGRDASLATDFLAVEEPLEIRLAFGDRGNRVRRAISITMRTPGHDSELAVGFLFTEGIITTREQVERVTDCGAGNVACVHLRPDVEVEDQHQSEERAH